MQALEGIQVVDLTHALAGPFCTYQLQLLGADVVKIERPGVGDDFREFARPDGWQVGPSFIAVNGGKRSLTVDLKHPAGQEIVRKLAARADVVVENQRPGSLARLGLDWPTLQQVNPRLVYCSLSGFGQTGDMRDWLAYDHTIQAMAGMMWSGGDDVPSQGRGFSVDCFAGYVAYASILASLFRRERSGAGQYLDVAMLDASMVLMGVGIVRQAVTGDQLPAIQAVVHDRPTVAAYRTADRWLFLSGNFQNHYVALCNVLDAPELLADPRFKDVRSRNAHSAELKAELARRFATRSAPELERQLMQAGCRAVWSERLLRRCRCRTCAIATCCKMRTCPAPSSQWRCSTPGSSQMPTDQRYAVRSRALANIPKRCCASSAIPKQTSINCGRRVRFEQ